MNWTQVFEKDVSDLSALKAALKACIPHFEKRQVILLKGDLGAGKTQSVRFLSELLGHSKGEITSPTFAIHNSYAETFQHLDLYRIEDEEELENTGFWDLFAQKEGVIAIEWPERVAENLFPRTWSYLTIQIEHQNSQRTLKLLKPK